MSELAENNSKYKNMSDQFHSRIDFTDCYCNGEIEENEVCRTSGAQWRALVDTVMNLRVP
jgi:hypothetical protein